MEKRILGSSEIQLLRAIKLLHNIKYTSISQFVINYRKQSSTVASFDSSFSQHDFCLGFLAQLPVSAQRYKHCLMKPEKDEDNRYISLEELFTLLQEAMPRQEYFRQTQSKLNSRTDPRQQKKEHAGHRVI